MQGNIRSKTMRAFTEEDHLDAISVTAGDQVGYGDMLGTVIAAADDGCIVGLGDHVHLAYRLLDAEGLLGSVDPAPFFIPTDR